jgi:hypothetical protein
MRTKVIDELDAEVRSLLQPQGYHIDETLAEAFDRLDIEVSRVFAHDPAGRGAVRRALWAGAMSRRVASARDGLEDWRTPSERERGEGVSGKRYKLRTAPPKPDRAKSRFTRDMLRAEIHERTCDAEP